MSRSFLFTTILIAMLAGCNAPSATPPADGVEPEPPAGPPLLSVFAAHYNLTTTGSAQAGGIYLHPNDPAGLVHPNCVHFRVLDSDVRFINVSAEWDSGSRLLLFSRVKPSDGPSRDGNYTIGTSPLAHDRALSSLGNEFMAIGVEPSPDLPAGAGTDDVRLHVEVHYAGRAVSLAGFSGCSENTT